MAHLSMTLRTKNGNFNFVLKFCICFKAGRKSIIKEQKFATHNGDEFMMGMNLLTQTSAVHWTVKNTKHVSRASVETNHPHTDI